MWCYHWPPEFSGAGLQARRLSGELVARGWTVWAISTSSRYTSTTVAEDGGIRVVWLPRPRTQRMALLAPLTIQQYWRALRRRRAEFDVLHVHSAYVDAALAATLARRWGKSCVVKNTLPGVALGSYGRGLWGRWQRSAFRSVGAFAAASPAAADEMLGLGLPAERIHPIPNGVDTDLFRPVDADERRALRVRLGLPLAARILINHSAITARKGTDTLVEALGRLAPDHPDLHLLLVGPWERDGLPLESDGPDWLSALKRRIADLGLADRVHMPGTQANTSEWLGAADVFVFPTLNDLLPSSLLEAMAMGLPIVASDVDCSRVLLRHGETGLVIPAGDPDALAGAIGRHLEHVEEGRAMGRAAAHHIAERYSLASVASAYERLYASLAAP